MSPTTIKASILLNGLRLIGVFDLLLELKKFVIDKLPEEEEEIGNNGYTCTQRYAYSVHVYYM